MRRFFQPTSPDADDCLFLDGAEAGHAIKVIRLKPGEGAVVLDGRGTEHQCSVLEVERRRVRLKVERSIEHPACAPRVTLFQSVLKGKAFEQVIQKSVELGATEIVPVLSERAIVKIEANERGTKHEKWTQVAVEAIKQSGSPWLPKIHDPMTLEEGLDKDRENELRFVASLEKGALHLRSVVDGFIGREKRIPVSVSLWIGPEGDFTPDEYRSIGADGVVGVSFGSRVLRSETAAACALSVIHHELSFHH